jgi:opacity protein-like surface antigen
VEKSFSSGSGNSIQRQNDFKARGESLLALGVLTAVLLLAPPQARAQAAPPTGKTKAESEIALVGGSSFGNIHLFAYAEGRRINPIGFEYDRNCWGKFLTARVDYVGEILPVVLLNEPARYNSGSVALTTARQVQYGAGISPIGVRLLWRQDKALQPYLVGKGGILYFENRVLSPLATHLNFSAQFGGGVEERLTSRLALRLGYSDFHFSNGDIAAHNPGIDMMYVNAGISYRLGK